MAAVITVTRIGTRTEVMVWAMATIQSPQGTTTAVLATAVTSAARAGAASAHSASAASESLRIMG